ncbi:hypothetical protein GGE67_002609 [Rhizobium leucaenae]|uniref:FAD dependent oxidoreductase domain-containing protein n=1 Tax=Rhizobium leucaenae TaxID=29450 RepID=A0A7W6ZVJ1_9HYPH|nr:hypothetical protein [Rhizobium leucaenae]MBB6301990.1 hypothetical protein [Rhizobium leucaenae]
MASRLPKRAGVSGWVATLPPRMPRPALNGPVTVDIAIIGGGFAGLSAARRISQLDPTALVAVLEAGIVGEGPAGANSGFIIDLPHEVSSDDFSGESEAKFRQSVLIQRSAIALATEMAAENGWGNEIFDPCGRYSVAMSADGDKHLEAYSGQLSKMGEVHRLLETCEIEAVTGSKAFTSGLFTPGTVIVQPAAYIRSVADCLKEPVSLFERTPVLSFERYGTGWLVKTPQGSVQAAKIVMANNGHAESFGFFRGGCCMSSPMHRSPRSSTPHDWVANGNGRPRRLCRWVRRCDGSPLLAVTASWCDRATATTRASKSTMPRFAEPDGCTTKSLPIVSRR